MRIGEYVHFAGYRSDMVPIATAADVAALSSDNEGTPVSLIEAAAAGTPAVATRVGGVPDVVRSRTPDSSSPPGDHKALGERSPGLPATRTFVRALGERLGATSHSAIPPTGW